MTANKSFHEGDSIVIEWTLPREDDVVVVPSSQAVQVKSPITGITYDPGTMITTIIGGVETEYDSVGGGWPIYLRDDDHYGIVFVPDSPGWHRFIIAGWVSAGVKMFSRMGTFYVQEATLRP